VTTLGQVALAAQSWVRDAGILSFVVHDAESGEVCAAGAPGTGGVDLVEGLNVLEAARLETVADPAERLFWWMQIAKLQALSFLGGPTRALLFGLGASDEGRTTPAWAEAVWTRMREGTLPSTRPLAPGAHSDAVVAVDRWGTVAALVHTSNTGTPWGNGLVVDGIALAAPALLLSAWDEQGAATAQVGAGASDPELLARVRSFGQEVRELDLRAQRSALGYWVGIRIDPERGELRGACPARLDGAVFGH
jgi:hypothetical protein